MTDESVVIHDADTDTYRDASGPLTIGGGGGPPSGSAGGVLDGTYPNPGLAAGVAGAGLAESSDVLSVNVDGTTLEITGDTLNVKSGVFDAAGAAAAAQAASQPLDGDLTAIAGLDSSTSGAIASDGSGWIKKSYSQFKTALSLVKGDVGLGNVDNTADALKNVATAAALTTARNIDGQAFDGTGNITVIAPGTHAATGKTTPVDADELALVDSAASNVLKKLTWANVKATLKAYFDTLYSATGAYAPGGTDVAVADGGTGASSAATARTNLGIAGVVGGVEWTVITKSGDESVSGSTTPQNDDELFFTAATGGVYEFELDIIYLHAAGAPNMKFDLGEDGTGRGYYIAFGRSTSGGNSNQIALASNTTDISFGSSTTAFVIRVFGTYTGNGGTFRLRWAQNASDANNLTVKTGSVLRYRRLV